jgi:hypothetical protein
VSRRDEAIVAWHEVLAPKGLYELSPRVQPWERYLSREEPGRLKGLKMSPLLDGSQG